MSPRAAVQPEHPPPQRGRVSIVALLFSLAAGPAAWAAQLMLGYGFSSYACFPGDEPYREAPPPGWGGERALLLVINLVCLLAPLAGGTVAYRAWRDTRGEAGESRTCFLALCGMLTSLGFALAILFDTAVIAGVPSCWELAK
jgi:hypothetical protein